MKRSVIHYKNNRRAGSGTAADGEREGAVDTIGLRNQVSGATLGPDMGKHGQAAWKTKAGVGKVALASAGIFLRHAVRSWRLSQSYRAMRYATAQRHRGRRAMNACRLRRQERNAAQMGFRRL